MTMQPNALSRLRRFGGDTSGLALLEFAFILPIVLTMGLTGAELTNYVTTKMRVGQIALQLADNAARIGSGTQLQAKTISEVDINDLLTGAEMQSGELDLFKNGRVIISSLEPVATPNANNKFKIAWQRCKGLKVGHTSSYGVEGDTDLNGMGPTGRLTIAPEGGASMFVEVFVEYKPIIKTSLSPSTEFTETASMAVRDRRDLSKIYNVENVAKATC